VRNHPVCLIGEVKRSSARRRPPAVGRSHRSSPAPVTARAPAQGSGTAIRVGLSYQRMGLSSSPSVKPARPTVCGYPRRPSHTKGRGLVRPASLTWAAQPYAQQRNGSRHPLGVTAAEARTISQVRAGPANGALRLRARRPSPWERLARLSITVAPGWSSRSPQALWAFRPSSPSDHGA
jgi:hypothetical protein